MESIVEDKGKFTGNSGTAEMEDLIQEFLSVRKLGVKGLSPIRETRSALGVSAVRWGEGGGG